MGFLKRNKNGSSSTNTSTQQESPAATDVKLVLNHPCFNEIQRWECIKINRLNIHDPSKKEMAKAYIQIICNVCKDRITKIDIKSAEELLPLFTGNSIAKHTSEIIQEINKTALLEAIPYIFIEKMEKSIYRYIGTMEGVILDIQLYGGSTRDVDKLLVTLDIIYTILRIIGDEIPTIVNEMNGELSMALKGSKYDVTQ